MAGPILLVMIAGGMSKWQNMKGFMKVKLNLLCQKMKIFQFFLDYGNKLDNSQNMVLLMIITIQIKERDLLYTNKALIMERVHQLVVSFLYQKCKDKVK